MTVNYDEFLERALEPLYECRFRTMDDYCSRDRHWNLIKLHGSVAWGRPLLNGSASTQPSFSLSVRGESLDLGEIQVLDGHQGGARFRSDAFYYPALSAPMGGKEEFSCPQSHLELIREWFPQCSCLLVVGFSGLDIHVLTLLSGSTRLRNARIINGNNDDGLRAFELFKRAGVLGGPGVDLIEEMGFGRFVNRRLTNYLSAVAKE